MSCREFFEQLPTGAQVNERAESVSSQKPNGCCESESVSSYSRGPVKDAEYLLRGVYSPIHIDPSTGTVVPTLFSDADNKGLSCDRSTVPGAGDASRTRGEERATAHREANAAASPRDFVGVVYAQAHTIRQLHTDGDAPHRAFYIYDTANATNEDHVDVFQDRRQGDAARKRLRKKLRDVFSQMPI